MIIINHDKINEFFHLSAGIATMVVVKKTRETLERLEITIPE